MKNKHILSLSILALAAAFMAACGQKPKDKSAELAALKEQKSQLEAQISQLEKEVGGTQGAPERIHTVGLTEVVPQNFRHYIDLQGRIDAEDNVPVTAKMPGTLVKVLVKNGDNVKKGQLLAQLDDDVMLKGLSELELQLKTAEDIYNRQRGLWDQKIGTEIQFIQAKTNKEALEQRIATMGMKGKILDVIVPTEEEIEVKDGKRRTVERRVFPGYILVQMILTEESWYVVRNTPGVTGFVGMGNDPTPLRADEVAKIMNRMEAEAPKVKFDFQRGEKVRIGTGPFADFIGTVSDIDAERAKVRVMVSFFGRETPVELDFLHVEKV
ncbi:MAG TPA: transcription termination/antitermination protein NusG [Saprospiraceae bacterium]|nr:transcription termination/antitermination protein NusG [Saprospiraceae bacterium]